MTFYFSVQTDVLARQRRFREDVMGAKVQFVACMYGQGVLFEGPQKGQNESKTIVLLSVVGFHGPLLGGRHSSL